MIIQLSSREAYNVIAQCSYFQFQFSERLLPASFQIKLEESTVTIPQAVEAAHQGADLDFPPDDKRVAVLICDDGNITEEHVIAVTACLHLICPTVYVVNGSDLLTTAPFLYSPSAYQYSYPSEIKANLFLGGAGCVDEHVLTTLGITTVISILDRNMSPPVSDHLLLRAPDSSTCDFLPILMQGSEYIKQAHTRGSKVLVHCEQGRSRSVSVIIAYLLLTNTSTTVEEALAFVKTCRPGAQPNSGFLAQLHTFRLLC
jgi:hypothetical protein